MRVLGKRNSAKDWARFAMTFGLLVTDAKLWSAMNDQIRQQATDVSDDIRRNYGEDTEGLRSGKKRRRRDNDWLARVTGFLTGIGVGIGVGMLIAPASGQQARTELRNRVRDVKSSISNVGRAVRSRSADESRHPRSIGS